MKVSPKGSWLICVPLEPPEKNGGVILPDEMRNGLKGRCIGVIQAAGPDVKDPDLHKNAVIVYDRENARYVAGRDTVVYGMIKAEHVIGIVEDDEDGTPEQVKKVLEDREKRRAPRLATAAGMVPQLVQ
jgi:hypothetical protein